MKNNVDHKLDFSPSVDSLEAADAVARTAHVWIRSIYLNETLGEDERYALAGGLVAGLCERLALNPRVNELVAYVYTLLSNEGGQALAISRMMLSQPVPAPLRRAYERGRSEATGIVEMLTFHSRE
ncbi:MAG: hypothetical protein ACR2RD_11970 [Woeseiaceae bacterium]